MDALHVTSTVPGEPIQHCGDEGVDTDLEARTRGGQGLDISVGRIATGLRRRRLTLIHRGDVGSLTTYLELYII